MRSVLDTAEKVLDHDASILILGESGAGKDFLAQAIHACGARRDEPFVHIECASVPADLFESELFGHERGTFTDAQQRKLGKLELARRGTVYFDELSALTPPLQAKLLRAMQERRFTRLGGNASVAFEARVLSSSSADVRALLDSGALRPDLYYRINVVTLAVPPLRERREDILPLAKKFLARRKKGFAADAERVLLSYAWPGNVRELRNAVERAVLVEDDDAIRAASLPVGADDLVVTAARGAWTLEQLESHYIAEVLKTTRANYSKAAEILGINRKTLLEKRRKYGLR
ncbi:MAG: sigma-54-dependent Fis family transcriptional regulator [Acidobacteria bacterium]|nr:sigma-54-dependent Fis family transcriptional regulator [Acidobacteriota bacterium]MBV9475405.1 sigma-54-dependent Fis family transcriptional regulator [Acidobacteriota bacterium]